MLNIIWAGLIGLSLITALFTGIFTEQNTLQITLTAMFDMAQTSVDIALGLVGLLCFWLGFFRIAELSGLIQALSKLMSPLFRTLMPEVSNGHPAIGSVSMNLAANMLGLDNAATPMGIRAMQDLQTLNPKKDTATNAQILFLVLNTSSVTLLPVTVFLYRTQQGAAEPTDVFVPILLATLCSTMAGLSAVAWCQRINLLAKPVLIFIAIIFALVLALVGYFSGLSAELMAQQSAALAYTTLGLTLITFMGWAAWRKVAVYDAFVEGAKQGFQTALTILPFLLAMLIALSAFRASGLLNGLLDGIRSLLQWLHLDGSFVDALPVALTKPFSGSGARALMIDTMNTYGADSFAGRLASVMQGSTETTFYVLAVYFGAIQVRKTRHAIGCGLFADFAGMTAAIAAAYWFFS